MIWKFIFKLVSSFKTRIGKCQNPIFAHFGRNWKVSELESVRIGKCQNWKVSELESVRIRKCQNWKVSELESVRIGKCQNYIKFKSSLYMSEIMLK